jgi:hypothetical protein
MNILIIDGQGGQLGAQLIKEIQTQFPFLNVTAVGTNAAATASMMKAGAKRASTGENPVLVACRKADVIMGPIGIVIADSLLGEITPKMAVAVGQADAARILIPMNKCENLIAGISGMNTASLIADAMEKLRSVVEHPST